MNNGIFFAGVSSLIIAGIAPAASAASVKSVTATHIEPVALLRNGAIAGCGLKADGRSGTVDAAIALTVFIDSTRPSGTRTVLAGSWSDVSLNGTQSIAKLRFKTATVDVAPRASTPTKPRGGHYEATLSLNALDGAQVFRETLLSGARATFELPSGAMVDFTIAGPAPHSVRAAYLNCAGDLLRPEPVEQAP